MHNEANNERCLSDPLLYAKASLMRGVWSKASLIAPLLYALCPPTRHNLLHRTQKKRPHGKHVW
jgi:hypothetical protein